MSAVRIRPAVPEDAEALADLYWEARQAAVPAIPRPVHSRASIGWWMREVILVERSAWLALDRDEVVGLLVLADPDWLDQLYVAPARQGQGIGGRLLELALTELGGRARLWCFESNTGAPVLRASRVRRGGADGRRQRGGCARHPVCGGHPRALSRLLRGQTAL
jgi:GNAT superfamily N-acetyltransferase